MTALQNELERLPADQQDRLAAFLTVLRMRRAGLMREVQDRLNDDAAENWVSWEDAKRDLGLDGSHPDQ